MTMMKHEAATDVANFAPSKYTGTCVDVASWYGIQKWMNTWIAWMLLWTK